MSTTPAAALDELAAALTSVTGLRLAQLGADFEPPGVVVGVPRLEWSGYHGYGNDTTPPSAASFPIFLVANLDPDKTVSELLRYGPLVGAAIEKVTRATVEAADPGFYTAGGRDLPAYVFTAEFPLS
ncbi:hypothetical protein [Amycolatopsis sp. CA-230715]|uniref:hypothetical protein n=1 Tax=Amycolatopsis sp. CA-230715 TaxID=2745196 RepID=UPI001C02216B|nr:hypothetical protein [Amycolatopsis sp. CA-230715]QWF81138.1 hypothetical protein HUW46_04564 [Amycolatopsis sp. CA-230715]